jgi:hypothetical protein
MRPEEVVARFVREAEALVARVQFEMPEEVECRVEYPRQVWRVDADRVAITEMAHIEVRWTRFEERPITDQAWDEL